MSLSLKLTLRQCHCTPNLQPNRYANESRHLASANS